jgi:hypothetical protein
VSRIPGSKRDPGRASQAGTEAAIILKRYLLVMLSQLEVDMGRGLIFLAIIIILGFFLVRGYRVGSSDLHGIPGDSLRGQIQRTCTYTTVTGRRDVIIGSAATTSSLPECPYFMP